MADFGDPGPEGPRFWAVLSLLAAVVFVAMATPPEVYAPWFAR